METKKEAGMQFETVQGLVDFLNSCNEEIVVSVTIEREEESHE